MATDENLKAKYFYSTRQAETYPLVVPDTKEFSIYKENIEYGCSRIIGKVSVLEMGCGTGRYFHFLKNIERLVGVDVSPAMLERARRNLKSIPGIKECTHLVQSLIEEFDSKEKFDFIYSIGTLGEYCSFDSSLFNKMVRLLKAGGFLFFTIVDAESYWLIENVSVKNKIKKILRKLPIFIWVRVFNKYISTEDFKHLFMHQRDLEQILMQSSMKIRWEMTKAKDTKHTHHICKVWLE